HAGADRRGAASRRRHASARQPRRRRPAPSRPACPRTCAAGGKRGDDARSAPARGRRRGRLRIRGRPDALRSCGRPQPDGGARLMPPSLAPAREGHWTGVRQDAIVLGLLLECADDFVAGGVLCDKLDVPRAELLKRIDSLRARGYVIHTRGGLGYRLVEIPDQLGDAQIAPLLASGELGRKIHYFEEVESTNDEAHRLAEAGALHGEVVVADFQTRGRGRRGRSWVAPRGKALTFSVVLRPAIAPARAPEITIAAAVAAAEAAREMGAGSARIKWPNDVACKGRKIAGLLTELRAEPDRVRHAVPGVGVT